MGVGMGWTFPVLFAVAVALLWVVRRLAENASPDEGAPCTDAEPLLPAVAPFEEGLAKGMGVLSLVYLALAAAMLPQAPRGGEPERFEILLHYLIPTALVWGLFWLEFLVSVIVHARAWTWRYRFSRLVATLAPPFRLCLPPGPGEPHWVPFVGWRCAAKAARRMERGFSAPMMVMALLVLPILAIEFIWAERIARGGVLDMLTGVGAGHLAGLRD